MRIYYMAGVVLLLALQFLCQAYAIELCEPQDYYNLADSAKCKITNNQAGDKNDSQNSMFEILKNYPYESKDKFVKLLQRKIELVGSYLAQQQAQGQTEKVQTNIINLEQIKQSLSGQLGSVNAATQENWVSVRDQARKALEEASIRLREIK